MLLRRVRSVLSGDRVRGELRPPSLSDVYTQTKSVLESQEPLRQ